MIVLRIQHWHRRIEFGFDASWTSAHGKLRTTPIGQVIADHMPIEHMLTMHQLFAIIFIHPEDRNCVRFWNEKNTFFFIYHSFVPNRMFRMYSTIV